MLRVGSRPGTGRELSRGTDYRGDEGEARKLRARVNESSPRLLAHRRGQRAPRTRSGCARRTRLHRQEHDADRARARTNVLWASSSTSSSSRARPRSGAAASARRASILPHAGLRRSFVLDARRCISLPPSSNTIRSARAPRPVGENVFGCDVAKRFAPTACVAAPLRSRARRSHCGAVSLAELLRMGNAGYRKLVKRTACAE